MLPSPLLMARVRSGMIRPIYADIEEANLEIAKTLILIFENHIGKRKGELSDEVKQYEDFGFDYRFIRGLAILLERRCKFVAKKGINPTEVRRLTFQEASKHEVVASQKNRVEILSRVAGSLGVSINDVEESLYGDLDDKLILKEFKPVKPEDLLRQYNFSLTQTLLFKSMRMEFTVKGNWKRIFRKIKHLGLMYSAEKMSDGFWVAVDGPLALFKLTERYGTSFAKLLPEIIMAEGWRIKALIVKSGVDNKRRILQLELYSDKELYLLKYFPEHIETSIFDSSIEEKFSRSFQSLGLGWKLIREPETLIAGTHVFIPDFCFQKDEFKVYMEIVGFWTQEYLEKKIQKLQQLSGVELIIAVDDSLACSKLKHIDGIIIYYRKAVPLRPIVDYLRELEAKHLTTQVVNLRSVEIKLEGEIIEISKLSEMLGVSEEAVKYIVIDKDRQGYKLIGNVLISEAKLANIDSKLSKLEDKILSKAAKLIENEGLRNPDQILECLGYIIKWHGLDMEKATLHKRQIS